ncbi:hypothetical protein QDW47_gp20 [Microbacterium phage AnnaLie]|uniref:hypothetical protein n=1 Tax=Microbacterium phage SansAfet TaxID=2653275 RepID=UPI0012A84740|nr:hypothetical protein QDW46_gp19 [Microbacterium phage SansAfet]YP_010754069.1 hypothetical protein QDW47_gp20 [Microbacterium phage AnnaLie]QFP94275.1 hypothetical protein SEA_SANSAFET_19 [Microbacterium phage SansAfet]QOC59469.1 hypothetical protein SEA_ANNALIE_20 [Microbacterium phage AnnaLie]QUE25498.1 hypothetical protein SEA_BELMONTSKP_20 [Microbacterium phage BelmontSKP]
MDDELDPVAWHVTCHTDGCENAGIPILILATQDPPLVVCGPCGAQITDLQTSTEGAA